MTAKEVLGNNTQTTPVNSEETIVRYRYFRQDNASLKEREGRGSRQDITFNNNNHTISNNHTKIEDHRQLNKEVPLPTSQ